MKTENETEVMGSMMLNFVMAAAMEAGIKPEKFAKTTVSKELQDYIAKFAIAYGTESIKNAVGKIKSNNK